MPIKKHTLTFTHKQLETLWEVYNAGAMDIMEEETEFGLSPRVVGTVRDKLHKALFGE